MDTLILSLTSSWYRGLQLVKNLHLDLDVVLDAQAMDLERVALQLLEIQ